MAKQKKRQKFSKELTEALLQATPEDLPALALMYNKDVDVLRARKWNLEHKDRFHNHQEGYRKKRRGSDKNNWSRWAPWEEELILKSKDLDIELSKQLGRTVEAIIQKRSRLLNDKKRKK